MPNKRESKMEHGVIGKWGIRAESGRMDHWDLKMEDSGIQNQGLEHRAFKINNDGWGIEDWKWRMRHWGLKVEDGALRFNMEDRTLRIKKGEWGKDNQRIEKKNEELKDEEWKIENSKGRMRNGE